MVDGTTLSRRLLTSSKTNPMWTFFSLSKLVICQKSGTTRVYFKPWEQVNIRNKSESYRKSFPCFKNCFVRDVAGFRGEHLLIVTFSNAQYGNSMKAGIVSILCPPWPWSNHVWMSSLWWSKWRQFSEAMCKKEKVGTAAGAQQNATLRPSNLGSALCWRKYMCVHVCVREIKSFKHRLHYCKSGRDSYILLCECMFSENSCIFVDFFTNTHTYNNEWTPTNTRQHTWH